ncbi:putative peptide zinc metalloprotease protein [Lipingzhangella halophila]|uniref:Putative peptide zinc metalloprotease protein n=1 Tax=Lipingzhangella halophila TaxID=1783352 RepID=A0A7W7RLA2_9ACTN|nr:daptide biosynthesis intramembrane metalloprotease [Lipingzhangella halophila]MBB4934084.1 putative peptide zinc metalloprotease protein [Lipingzhangella halophila]
MDETAEFFLRPKLAPGVEIHEPQEEGASWVLKDAKDRYFRVGRNMGLFVRELDGRRDHAELVGALGRSWTVEHIAATCDRLYRMDLLDDGTHERAPGKHISWISFAPPFIVYFNLLRHPERIFRLTGALARLFAGRSAGWVMAVTAGAGVLALAVQSPTIVDVVANPLPMSVLGAVVIALFCLTVVHEFSHGAALAYHGRSPNRMGVMLFYLSPAFFCDVSDGWMLPRRHQRVGVALAGIVVQMAITCAVAVAALAFPDGNVRDALLVFAALTLVAGTLNLLPFVKLDGYIALMNYLDTPFLRAKAMDDARGFFARIAFGTPWRRNLRWWWSVPYGMACLLFPAVLVFGALGIWAEMFSSFGIIGYTVIFLLIFYIAYRAVGEFARGIKNARAAHAERTRMWIAVTGLTVAAVGALAVIPVPYAVSGGYVHGEDGSFLVFPESVDRARVGPGATVTLQDRGVLLRSATGSAVLADEEPALVDAPLNAFSPIELDDSWTIPVTGYPMESVAGEEGTGTARVDLGYVPLGEWMYRMSVAPMWN